jgi:hypothetical protein
LKEFRRFILYICRTCPRGRYDVKNRFTFLIAALSSFVCGIHLAGAGPGEEQERRERARENESDGRITYIEGTCLIKPEGGAYRAAAVDQEVFSSDTVKTGLGSEAEVTLRDGSGIVVTEDTELTVSQFALGEKRYTSIGLLIGRVRTMVGKLQKGGEFSVNTLTVTAAVRGTVFEASVREDGAVLIGVEEGLVEVEYEGGPGGAGLSIGAGEPGKVDELDGSGANGESGSLGGWAQRREIPEGETIAFYLSGEQEKFRGRIDPGTWRGKAPQTIRENPGAVVRTLLERERAVIEALKKQQGKADEYRREWAEFLRKVQYLESRGLYEREEELIEAGMEKTRRGLLFLMRARRNLTVMRSILVIAVRIERTVGPDGAKDLPSIEEIRKEYGKIGFVIGRLQDAEAKLKRVLSILNNTLSRLESKT